MPVKRWKPLAHVAVGLAGKGADVLLIVDRGTCARLDPPMLEKWAGRVGRGPVTVVRLATHPRDHARAESWPMASSA